ncbi:hypothetical protein CBR_g63090 [Chara braunii]|uniref:Myb/SANT-like DNA-binding domain-containing protein n=1 Tax=Chara braunii TaxID=69332 RepID=A0A388K902_CHABU|nr:hypothetical protein CBR_g63090 [Chara braunii]|eukprot:GBG66507.1 hypothetical protein CBR_g63090 [Chara braunii]
MLYAHLPSHEIPLMSTDDECEDVRSSVVPLGSGSTKDWVGTQSFSGRQAETPWSYTSMLNEGLCCDDGNAGVDLTFQLSTSSGVVVTHTHIINPHPDGDCDEQTWVARCGARDGRQAQALRDSGGNRYLSSMASAGGGGSGDHRPEWMRSSPAPGSGSRTPRRRQQQDYASATGADALRPHGTESMMKGVQRLDVNEGDDAADHEPYDNDDMDGDEGYNSEELPDIRPFGRKAKGGRGVGRKGSTTRNRTDKKMDDDTCGSDGEGAINFWSVGDTIVLVRAKRDQDLYFSSMGHNFGCMKTREWKWEHWEDVRLRLDKAGVTRKVVDCGKKWDKLMQQFKKVHKFQQLSSGRDYFKLLLVASIWLMRMAGDDLRSHYEAFYFAKLMAKPTLIASMYRSCEHRRSVVRATNVVTERLGKANATLGEYPKYIPDWEICGIVFGFDASIAGQDDAKRLDWLGGGPLEDDKADDGKDDA